MHRLRKGGILLHPTSLPGPGGIGTLGDEALRFVDFLAAAGQSIWQVLPLGATAYGNSPYSCYSAFAGNPLLIDLDLVAAEGDLCRPLKYPDLPGDRVDYHKVEEFKYRTLRQAAASFFCESAGKRLEEFHRFCDSTWWLHDFALFMALKEESGGKNWRNWPESAARHSREAYEEASLRLGVAIGEHKYIQWQFFRQWERVKAYANARGVEIFGDIPIFVAFDSADVWANPHLFLLDGNENPLAVAGVPPDYFSATGQLWGNPLYRWDVLAGEGYRWWIERVKSSLTLYDILRIDHFRGFAAHWEVPAGETTAVNGRWVNGPGAGFFEALAAELGTLPIVAEDLGVITHDVEELRDRFGLPGMKILQFAFDSGSSNPYLPHNHVWKSVVYTGTHDNDTTVGWYEGLDRKQKARIIEYLDCKGKEIHWDFIRAAWSSVADTAIIPLQDLLGLGSEAKMNKPGTAGGNWSWRLLPGALTSTHAERLRELTKLYGRLPRRSE